MTPLSVRTTAHVEVTNPEGFLSTLLDHLETHADVERGKDGAHIVSVYGNVWLRRAPPGLKIEAIAATPSALAIMRGFIADHVFEFAGDAQIRWSGDGAEDTVPANFQEVIVERVEAITPRMRRIVFRAGNLPALLCPDHFHVRLLFPAERRAPCWPRQSANGRVVWPTGEDALSSRVYTIRWADDRTATFAIDFVLHHDGTSGPGAAFACRAKRFAVAGLLGPGGGGMPPGNKLLLIGDETALPAMARIAETSGVQTGVEAIVEIADDAERAYLCPRPGFQVTWLPRNGRPAGQSEALLQAVESRLVRETQALTVWAGCEHRVAAQLRAKLAAFSQCQSKGQITAYWKRDRQA